MWFSITHTPRSRAISIRSISTLIDAFDAAKNALAPLIMERSAIVMCGYMPLVYADRALVTRVLHNLVQNAIAHSSHPVCVHVGVEYEDGFVRVCVRDNGQGHPARTSRHDLRALQPAWREDKDSRWHGARRLSKDRRNIMAACCAASPRKIAARRISFMLPEGVAQLADADAAAFDSEQAETKRDARKLGAGAV